MGIECTTTACEIFINHVVPLLGCFTALAIFLAPWNDVLKVAEKKSLGQINANVFPLILANTFGWILYGLLLKNYYIAIGNVIGFLISLHYTFTVLPYAPPATQVVISRVSLLCISLVLMASVPAYIALAPATGQTLLGSTCVVILVGMYGSPLSTLYHVVKTRNSASLSFQLAIANLANGTFWGVYGLAIGDIFVWGPNVVGAALAIVNLTFRFLFPPKNTDSEEGNPLLD